MKQKHFLVALLVLAFTAFYTTTLKAHPHARFNHCNRGGYAYGYRCMPPPPPPPMYYGYIAPRYFHHRRPHRGYGGYRQHW
ncbi:MAG: hypothetical protein RL065_1142 [Bacteroidota bacterium]